MAASNEETDVAGLHLIDEESGEYNLPFVEKYGKGKVVLIRGYSREQGIIIPKGNPKGGIRGGIRDLLRSDVSIVNRNKGAGTRFLLDSLLKRIAAEDGVSFNDLMGRINGYYYEVRTHTAVAAAVSQGKADAGGGGGDKGRRPHVWPGLHTSLPREIRFRGAALQIGKG